MNNVFSKASFIADSFQLMNLASGAKIQLQMMDEYFYGTNLMEFQFGFALNKGKYEFRALANQLRDPFGNALAGGDFVYSFQL